MGFVWRRTVFALAIGLAAATIVPSAEAQTGQNILLVGNALSRASDDIATYYARKRGVPSEQILRLNIPVAEEISRAAYLARIERPIAEWLAVHTAQDRILYIVLTKDMPLRIAGSIAENGTVSSVDSELTLLYRRLAGGEAPIPGPVPNPYFAGDATLKGVLPFTHRVQDTFLVTRLDGYTVQDVKALIDRGSSPSRDGAVVLDARLELAQSPGNTWLNNAAEALRRLPGWSDRVVFDSTATVVKNQTAILGHYSWGSNDRTAGSRHLNNTFAPGAIGAEFVSTDARTFQEPPATWTVNDKPFGGSPQSLIGDLIRDGITGVAGHVAEPYLRATIRPDVLFVAYANGFNLAEAFYLAMPSLSWQTVVIGDPLCSPFGKSVATADDLDPPVDPSTDLPVFLSRRRLAAASITGAKPDALPFMIKAETHLAKRDRAAARRALEQATVIDPGFTAAHMQLASLYELAGESDAAIARYQAVIAKRLDVAALNNLAYLMATAKGDPAGALPIARRAYAAGKASPELADTLGWIHHLLGNRADALAFISEAARQRPESADIRLHAAHILAATGDVSRARLELEAALRLSPALIDRREVQDLQTKLTK